MADFKLYYFNFWGRGEVCRLLLAASGREWEDVRFSREDWPKYKPLAPFGQAPFLCYKGKYYGQSLALASFLAREFGYAGSSSVETLRNDEVLQLVEEMTQRLVLIYYETDAAKKTELTSKMLKEDAPRFCGLFQKILMDNGNCGHFVGSKLSHADVAVYDVITNTQTWLNTDFETDHPALKKLRSQVDGVENIRKYLEANKEQLKTA